MAPPKADADKDCMGYAFCPDEETDAKKAMASPNSMMTVSSSHDAVITPLWMDSEPNGIGVSAADDNMPFKNVDWNAMQSTVANMGVSFKAVRVSIGANQEKIPTSEILYITCGPFACSDAAAEKPQAPEISAESTNICANWDPDLTLQVGMIDNDTRNVLVSSFTGYVDQAPARGGNLYFDYMPKQSIATTVSNIWYGDDGIDIGWSSTSDVDMKVKHVFGSYSVMGPDANKGTNKFLNVDLKAENISYAPAVQTTQLTGVTNDRTTASSAKVGNLSDACVEATEYSGVSGSAQRPNNCFRLRVSGTETAGFVGNPRLTDYLSSYSVEVSPKDPMLWGKVAWKDGPLKDLKCETMRFAAADQIDVCELLEEEVDHALSGGWDDVEVKGSKRERIDPNDGGAVVHPYAGLLRVFLKNTSSLKPRYFRRLWFDDNMDGSIVDKPATFGYLAVLDHENDATGQKNGEPVHPDEADDEVGTGWDHRLIAADASRTKLSRRVSDLYNYHDYTETESTLSQNGDYLKAFNINAIWTPVVDQNLFPLPKYGDFGKVDVAKTSLDAGARKVTAAIKGDGIADNYYSAAAMCSDEDGGKGCDAKWEDDFEILFSDLMFGCEATRTVTISCEWDAQGTFGRPPLNHKKQGDTDYSDLLIDNMVNFAKCTVE